MEIELEELRAKRDTMQHWETQVSDVNIARGSKDHYRFSILKKFQLNLRLLN